jgi:hypothetical protein
LPAVISDWWLKAPAVAGTMWHATSRQADGKKKKKKKKKKNFFFIKVDA